ncbi:3848_t:CDS:2, partial [Entrophospora sp. SA101]
VIDFGDSDFKMLLFDVDGDNVEILLLGDDVDLEGDDGLDVE